MSTPIQDNYPAAFSHCYGCGTLNEHGLHIQSYWENGECICDFAPRDYHTAFPGYVYGGLIASLIDCHGIGTCAAAAQQAAGDEPGTEPVPRFVTASLHVDYVKPTPLGPLQLRARPSEVKARRVVVSVELWAEGELCVRGEVVGVRLPERLAAAMEAAG